jgi:hypothetical protein
MLDGSLLDIFVELAQLKLVEISTAPVKVGVAE